MEKKYLVTSKMSVVIESTSKEKAIKKFYDVTDGTEYIETAKLIKSKKRTTKERKR